MHDKLTKWKESHRTHVKSGYTKDATKTRKKRNITIQTTSKNERRATLDKKA